MWFCCAFSHVPDTIINCSALKKLFVSHNRIDTFPAGLSLLKNLEELHLCNNQVRSIPRSVGSLRQLKKLWLDWNKIESVPPSVKFLADTLEELKLQGNPLVFPPMSVVLKGLSHVFAWTKAKAAEHAFVRQRGATGVCCFWCVAVPCLALTLGLVCTRSHGCRNAKRPC